MCCETARTTIFTVDGQTVEVIKDFQGDVLRAVLAQREMEKGRSPLVSIPPFGQGFSRHGVYRPMTSSRQRATRENDLPRCRASAR